MQSSLTTSALGQEFERLFKQLTLVLDNEDLGKLGLTTKPNPIRVGLNRYTKVYAKTSPEEHVEHFNKVYHRYRVNIVASQDSWLTSSQPVVIHFSEPKDNVCIRLSAVFGKSLTQKVDAEKRLEGLPDDAYQACEELIRPDAIRLHLYRIFKLICPEEDRIRVSALVAEIERDLGIGSDGVVAATGDGLGGLIGMATQALGKFGLKPPQGTQMPSAEAMTRGLNTLLTSDATQNVMKSVFTNLQGASSLEDAITRMAKTVTNPSTIEAIGRAVGETVGQTVGASGVAVMAEELGLAIGASLSFPIPAEIMSVVGPAEETVPAQSPVAEGAPTH